MNLALRLLLALAALITGLLALTQYLALVPPGTIPQDWIIKAGIATVLLMGAKNFVIAAGDVIDNGKLDGSFNIDNLKDDKLKDDARAKLSRLSLLVCLLVAGALLPACTSAERDAALSEAKASGKRVLSATAKAAEDAALAEVRRLTSAKQPVNVTP